MPPFRSFVHFLRKHRWLAILLVVVPILIYFLVFSAIALNVNYVAYDDILILGIIPGFEDASWLERWQRITDPFPEHRLIFSRSLVLLSYSLFNKVNLVGLMTIGNLCWLACAGVFYAVFRPLRQSLWYFVPVVWLWFSIQSFENMFWGVSSLCNYGVLLFTLLAFYFTTHKPQQLWIALLCAAAATYTYGNGIMSFVIIAFLLWITGRRKDFFITAGVAILIGVLYFAGFPQKTDSLDFSDGQQVKEGIAGFFGFIGSIATLDAYTTKPLPLGMAVVTGVLMIGAFLLLFRKKILPLVHALLGKPLTLTPTGQFALGIFVFVAITSFAVIYKRIPLGGFESLFKGRYRMYTALALVAMHFGALTWLPADRRRNWGLVAVPLAVVLNVAILYINFELAVNNRRAAIVQEFNSRYNADWLGLRMFDMDQKKFETIRAFYRSDDPLAEGWDPRTPTDSVACAGEYDVEKPFLDQDEKEIHVYAMQDFIDAEQDYTDGPYLLLKSDAHVYASSPAQFSVPLHTFLRRARYFARGFGGSFHKGNVEPGEYKVYVLLRKNGKNTLYCTNRTWTEPE